MNEGSTERRNYSRKDGRRLRRNEAQKEGGTDGRIGEDRV